MKEIKTKSADETMAFAAQLALSCKPGDVVALVGDLGAGKTTFARGFIQALAGPEEVVSPTFTLAQPYEVTTGEGVLVTLWHYDLYRLKDIREAEELGMEEAFEAGIALIEWPDIIESLLPQHHLRVEITPGSSDEERVITVKD